MFGQLYIPTNFGQKLFKNLHVRENLRDLPFAISLRFDFAVLIFSLFNAIENS